MSTELSDLEEGRQSGLIDALDLQLAGLLERLAKEHDATLAWAIALASQATRRGHACLDLRAEAGLWPWDSSTVCAIPSGQEMLATAKLSPSVGGPGEGKPLILAHDRWLYLYRYWRYEERLAQRAIAWREQVLSLSDETDVPARIGRLFGHFSDNDLAQDEQARAVQEAIRHPFFLLTGGPGTGKTTTVARLLALMLEREPELRIALAAPTGKAALRLQESLQLAREELTTEEAVRARLPMEASTLHRLLGYQPGKASFLRNAGNPLPYDLVVVDEASMIDLPLAAKLLDALRPEARLILVGDRGQLPSVEVGAVFADLCAPECRLPQARLLKNHRFTAASGIGGLAEAIQCGDLAAMQNVLADDTGGQIAWRELPSATRLRECLHALLESLLAVLRRASEPEEVFAALGQARVLCALRHGAHGSEAINRAIRDMVVSRRGAEGDRRWYAGQPVMITENDYSVDLFNGDTGVILPWEGRLQAFFPEARGKFRRLPPDRLPAHELAYAMTVHKSQGSEFNRVSMILPPADSPVLTRELLYTGVTRAREFVEIFGSTEVVTAALQRPLGRMTGLRRQLSG